MKVKLVRLTALLRIPGSRAVEVLTTIRGSVNTGILAKH
jgi:hypothetical protein